MQRHNQEFKPIGYDYEPENTKYEVDKCNNKIYHSVLGGLTQPISLERPTQSHQREILKQIAQKVEANADLFAEIESRTKNMAADKVISYDIQLIVKEFQHYSALDCPLLDGKYLTTYLTRFKRVR